MDARASSPVDPVKILGSRPLHTIPVLDSKRSEWSALRCRCRRAANRNKADDRKAVRVSTDSALVAALVAALQTETDLVLVEWIRARLLDAAAK